MKTYIKPVCDIMEVNIDPFMGAPSVKQLKFTPGVYGNPSGADAIGRRNSWGQGIDW